MAKATKAASTSMLPEFRGPDQAPPQIFKPQVIVPSADFAPPVIVPTGMTFGTIEVDEATATMLLERGAAVAPEGTPAKQLNLRPLSWNLATRFSDDMIDGLWRLTHQALAFLPNGFVHDGQHRLWAVKLAYQKNPNQKPVKFSIAYNVDPETFDVIDTGKTRSASDNLSVKNRRNTMQLAATLKLLFCFLALEPGHVQNSAESRVPAEPNKWRSVQPSTTRLDLLLDNNPSIDENVVRSRTIASLSGLTAAAVIAARFILIRAGNSPKAVDQFLECLASGDGMPYLSHPALKLRDWAKEVRNPASRSKIRVQAVGMSKGALHLRLIFDCWLKAIKGKQMQTYPNYTRDGLMPKIGVWAGDEKCSKDELPGLAEKQAA